MEDFNSQYANHSKLEQLKQFILEHGTYIELKKGEQFTIQGKVNHRGAYIEHGLLRYTRVDEKGNIHIVGYTFSGEFTGSLCTLIEPNQPSLVTIEAVCDTKICYIPYLKVEEFFATNVETMQTRVRDNILKSKEQKNIQPTKGGHKMVTCQNYVSLFYRQITSCPSDGGIS